MLGPAERPIRVQDAHIVVTQIGKHRSCLLGELPDALHGVDLGRYPGEHRRRVARARADLEDALSALQAEGLRHERHDVGLRDRLLRVDRERGVLVGKLPQSLRQKRLARDGPHRIEHEL